jgi:hypothetical protein
MTFINSLQARDDTNLFLWLPFAIQIGIFLGISLENCIIVSQKRIHVFLLLFLEGSRRLTLFLLEAIREFLVNTENERLPR